MRKKFKCYINAIHMNKEYEIYDIIKEFRKY